MLQGFRELHAKANGLHNNQDVLAMHKAGQTALHVCSTFLAPRCIPFFRQTYLSAPCKGYGPVESFVLYSARLPRPLLTSALQNLG